MISNGTPPKILSIVGARPNFIKLAALDREIRKRENLKHVIVHTGQHYDENMSKVFFDEMEIPKPDHNMGVKEHTHGLMLGRMLEKVEKILLKENPDIAVVYGDTNSTLAGALSAAKLRIPVAHIEAGMRSFNMKMPEEINRIITDRVSSLLFCSTDAAAKNLENEGFKSFDCRIIKSGDIMFDAAKYYGKISGARSDIVKEMKLDKFVLCTVHRAENTDEKKNLLAIINALEKINAEIPVVFSMHPRTRKMIRNHGISSAIRAIEPVDYFSMLELLKKCSLVMTDSGGVQKEAFFFEKPCVTLRNETEWVELVENGYNRLSGLKEDNIYDSCKMMLEKKSDFNKNLYGDGNASKKIADVIIEFIA